MRSRLPFPVLPLVIVSAFALPPAPARAQSVVLDAASASSSSIPATPANVLRMGVPSGPAAGPLPAPLVGLSAASLGLLPGDVIDALSFGDDTGGVVYFSVSRASASSAGLFPPNVFTQVGGVPPGIQGEAAGDIFVTLDPATGVPVGAHTQVLDGNGVPLGPTRAGASASRS
jgi:hypothetical protein